MSVVSIKVRSKRCLLVIFPGAFTYTENSLGPSILNPGGDQNVKCVGRIERPPQSQTESCPPNKAESSGALYTRHAQVTGQSLHDHIVVDGIKRSR